jgi:hypothetical protein
VSALSVERGERDRAKEAHPFLAFHLPSAANSGLAGVPSSGYGVRLLAAMASPSLLVLFSALSAWSSRAGHG